MATICLTTSAGASSLSYDSLEKRLARETRARIEAERLLEDKSRRLYAANKALEKVAENLEGQRQQLNTILDHTVAAIFLVNENMKVVQSNRAANDLFELTDDGLLDLCVLNLFERSETIARLLKKQFHIHAGEEITFEGEATKIGGSRFPFECGVTAIERRDGRRWTCWIISDITRRRRDEAKRANLEKELSQAQKMEALGTLASGVAHEINTPIQYVGDNLRFLKDGLSDISSVLEKITPDHASADLLSACAEADTEFLVAEIPEAIEQSLHGLEQVARIVKAIKEFSHPGNDGHNTVDLNEAIETTVTVTRNQWKYVAEIDLDLAPGLPLAPCSPGDLNQVILNMIVNAADAIAEKGDSELGRIHIVTHEENGWINICISDTGCGMSADVQERMFDPFFITKDVGKGSGQGLAISYNIIRQKHHGEILCSSEPGQGTMFTLRIPATPDAMADRYANS